MGSHKGMPIMSSPIGLHQAVSHCRGAQLSRNLYISRVLRTNRPIRIDAAGLDSSEPYASESWLTLNNKIPNARQRRTLRITHYSLTLLEDINYHTLLYRLAADKRLSHTVKGSPESWVYQADRMPKPPRL